MQKILITGANRGIGLALVKEYLKRDVQIFAACRNPQEASELQALQSEKLCLITLDISDEASIANAVEAVAAQTDKLDILINNAGIYPKDAASASFGQLKAENLAHILHTNSISPVMVTQAFLDLLKKAKPAKVLMVSSKMGSITTAGTSGFGYRMSKTALNLAVKVMAQVLAPEGVTVVTTHPGHVATDMGGAGAAVSPVESAQGLIRILDTLSPEKAGHFYNYTGEELPW
jgi:NAD(P)-dependent dehydrogenase (short-subunit alcohol dehydrogenase family)